MKNRLSIKKERLAELTTDELFQVAGAAQSQLCVNSVAGGGCNSDKWCTTAISCGCPLTYPLSDNLCN